MVDLEFDFWFCAAGFGGLRSGFWVDFGGGFGSRWVAGSLVVGCGVGLGGWHLAVVVPFWWIPVGFGCGFFLCFVLRCSKQCRIFFGAFS